MSIFATKQFEEFNPNSLLEVVLSTADFINNREEELSYHAINDCPRPENYKMEEEKCINSINEKLEELITAYNGMDIHMNEFVNNNPVSIINISDEEFTKYKLSSDIRYRSIPFGRYLDEAIKLFKNTDMNNIKCKEELEDKIKIMDDEFKKNTNSPDKDRFLIHQLYDSYSLTYDTFRMAGETLNVLKDPNCFNNPVPYLTGDYLVKLEVMNFLSSFKAALYSAYQSMILCYNDCVVDIMRRDY